MRNAECGVGRRSGKRPGRRVTRTRLSRWRMRSRRWNRRWGEGGLKADAGERVRRNVRKAVQLVMRQLRKGGLEEKAFAEHLRTHLSTGHERLYNQPEGRIWG